jgi:hypothetical protein
MKQLLQKRMPRGGHMHHRSGAVTHLLERSEQRRRAVRSKTRHAEREAPVASPLLTQVSMSCTRGNEHRVAR